MATILRPPLVSDRQRKRPIPSVDYFSRPLTLGINPNAVIAQLSDSAPQRKRWIHIDVYPNLLGRTLASGAPATLSIAQGIYSLSGQSINLAFGPVLPASQGSYALSGQSITLTQNSGAKTLTIDQGSYTYLGSDAAVDLVMAIGQGSYALTGNDVGAALGHVVGIGQGSYPLSGQAVGLVRTAVLSAAQGAYSLNGQNVTIGQTGNKLLPIGQGSYSLNGQNVSLISLADAMGGIGRPFYPGSWWALNYLPA